MEHTTDTLNIGRTIRVRLVPFNALDPERQDAAIQWYRDHRSAFDAEAWADEWNASKRAAEDCFGIRTPDYRGAFEVGGYIPTWDLDLDRARLPWVETAWRVTDEVSPMGRARAWKWAMREWAPLIGEPGSCPWTGYCGDEAFLDPMRAFLADPRSVSESEDILPTILEACAESFVRAWHADIESAYDDETIRGRLADDVDGFEWDAAGTGGAPY